MSQLKRSKHIESIPFAEIESATNNFADSNSIGKGGYGMVFKGELRIPCDSERSTPVAIKRLNQQFGQGSKEFLTEINLLAGEKHVNLINLVGYCDDRGEKILVYEYAELGSLDKYLRPTINTTGTLTWLKRLDISLGAARGLDYLHNGVGNNQTIIHRDIKSANILIDENWVAKISDLGLSKVALSGLDRSEVVSHPCGTYAYCEPEYRTTGILTKEVDVYSFGMVLFELLCGTLCTIKNNDNGFSLSSSSAKKYYEENRLGEIVDPRLKEEMKLDSMNKFAETAYACLHDDRKQRPTMGRVVKQLEESLTLQAFLIEDDGEKSKCVSSHISQSSGSKSYSNTDQSPRSGSKSNSNTDQSQSTGSNSYSNMDQSRSSSSKSYSDKEQSQSSSSKSYLQAESRYEKVLINNKQFDLNTDNGVSREELAAPIVGIKTYVLSREEENFGPIDDLLNLFEDGGFGSDLAFPEQRNSVGMHMWLIMFLAACLLYLLSAHYLLWKKFLAILKSDDFLSSLHPDYYCKWEICKMFFKLGYVLEIIEVMLALGVWLHGRNV